jgi:hypothetical protein
MAHQEEEPPIPNGSKLSMALFFISIPLMILAVALAVLPLIVMSFADSRRTAETTSTPAGSREGRATSEDKSIPQAA